MRQTYIATSKDAEFIDGLIALLNYLILHVVLQDTGFFPMYSASEPVIQCLVYIESV